jgi:hypothetical protein
MQVLSEPHLGGRRAIKKKEPKRPSPRPGKKTLKNILKKTKGKKLVWVQCHNQGFEHVTSSWPSTRTSTNHADA